MVTTPSSGPPARIVMNGPGAPVCHDWETGHATTLPVGGALLRLTGFGWHQA